MNLTEIYRKYVTDLFRIKMRKGFEPFLDYTCKHGKLAVGPPHFYSLLNVFDMDYTLTLDNTFDLLVQNLKNRKFKEIWPKARKLMKKLTCAVNETYYLSKLNQMFRETGLRREDLMSAKDEAVREVKLAPGALATITKLWEMGFINSINSGEPQEVVEDFAKLRLSIPPKLAYGSKWIWKDGRFYKLYHNLGYNKVRAMRHISSKFGCSHNLTVYVADVKFIEGESNSMVEKLNEAEIPPFLNSGHGLRVGVVRGKKLVERIGEIVDGEWFEDKKNFPDVIYVESPVLQEDMERIVKPIKVWLISELTVSAFDPKTYLSYRNLFKKLETYANVTEATKAEEFVRICKLLRKEFELIFPYAELDVDNRIGELEEQVERGSINRSTIKEILDSFKRSLAECHYEEVDWKVIEAYAEIQDKRFEGRWKGFASQT